VNAITGGNRCKALTIAGPLVGNVTLAGSTPLFIHDDITLPATGLTRDYFGAITLSGTGAGKIITTNGVILQSLVTVNGVGSEWTLTGALTLTASNLIVTNGSIDFDTYSVTVNNVTGSGINSKTIDFGSSTVTVTGGIAFGTTENERASLTFVAGTSQINTNGVGAFSGNNKTFYNVSYTGTSIGTTTINGANTFNNLSFAGRTSAGVANVSLTDNQTINGTLTLSAGTNATMRTFVRSDTIGTTRTLTCAAVASLTDIDFRDITIAGAAAPVSGTRLGDCKGNSGITFVAGADKYWNLAFAGDWGGAIGWATSSGGTPAINNFPLAQDTCIFEASSPNSGFNVSVNAAYNIGTIDMSARTTNTMTLTTGSAFSIYGNWINGTGVTLSGINVPTFAGRGAQTITSAGVTWTQGIAIDTPSGSVTLQDAFTNNRVTAGSISIVAGTFNANVYNVTLTGSATSLSVSQISAKTLAIGSGTWTVAGTGGWSASASTNLTVTGTGTISLTSASNKSFGGGGISYSGITLDQGGVGTLTITGNNTFKDITNSAAGAATIAFGTTTQTVTQFTATGTAGNVLTLQGTSATSPATLILTSGTVKTPDYLTITGIRAYDLSDTWYAGANSTNNGSLGWIFSSGLVPSTFFIMFN
jgi:hypothetical protein